MTKRSRMFRTLRAGGIVVLVLVAGAGLWHTVQDMRLRRAFGEALEGRENGAAPRGPARDGDGEALRFALVSYNVWALPVPLPGLDRVGRLPRIPGALREMDADLILLQEAFDVRMRAFLAAYLQRAYHGGPDDLCREPMVPIGVKDCTGGLMTLSRFPVTGARFYVHPVGEDPKLDEKNGRKGLMVTTVETPLGPVDVVNIHLYAGRTAADEEHRLLQLAQLRDVVGPASASSRPVLLAGDLNVVHPFLSARDTAVAASKAYRFLVDSLGFVDTHPDAGEADLSYDVTTNRFANLWFNRFEGRQIFDYVMVRLPEGMAFEVLERRRILDGASPLSDHYGVFAELEVRRAP